MCKWLAELDAGRVHRGIKWGAGAENLPSSIPIAWRTETSPWIATTLFGKSVVTLSYIAMFQPFLTPPGRWSPRESRYIRDRHLFVTFLANAQRVPGVRTGKFAGLASKVVAQSSVPWRESLQL